MIEARTIPDPEPVFPPGMPRPAEPPEEPQRPGTVDPPPLPGPGPDPTPPDRM